MMAGRITTAETVSFHVEVVRPGQTVTLPMNGQSVRNCSLASGKLRVRLSERGEADFSLSVDSIFTVLPGAECVVENRQTSVAKLHVTSVVLP